MSAAGAPRTLILGLGRQGGGVPTAVHLLRRGRALRIADRGEPASLTASVEAVRAAAADVGVSAPEWSLGANEDQRAASDPDRLLDGCDLVVVNPAIPDHHPVLVRAAERGIARTQEVELALGAFPGRVVLVTGTNGKSTTSTLLEAALRGLGVRTLLGGNIGRSLFADEDRWTADTVAVVEISSFQLDRLPVRPADGSHGAQVVGAVLTEMGVDHLDRHGTVAAYHAAKARAAARAERFVVHFADDPVAASFAVGAGGDPAVAVRTVDRGGSYGGERRDAASVTVTADGWLEAAAPDGASRRLVHMDALAGIGRIHLANAGLAAAGALEVAPVLAADGVAVPRDPVARVGTALATAPPLPFRLGELPRRVVTRAGAGAPDAALRVFDNAVSTEVESTGAALAALVHDLGLPVVWIGGGKSKTADLEAVAARLLEHLAPDGAGPRSAAGPRRAADTPPAPPPPGGLVAACVFGADGPALAEALQRRGVAVEVRDTVDAALDAAAARAAAHRPHAALLFSPACASFDAFANFRARADAFHSWLRAHASPSHASTEG